MKPSTALAQILFTQKEPVDDYEFKCRDVRPSLPDVPPAPPRGIGPTFGYYHCQPMTQAHELRLSGSLQDELQKYGHLFNPAARTTYAKLSREEVNAKAKKDFGIMTAIKAPPDAFIICAHGTRSHIVRWESIVLLHPRLNASEEIAETKGYWTAKRFFNYMRCHEPCTEKVEKFEKCEYIIILACNSGNEIDKTYKYTENCFAQELANLTNKPCYAPEGYLLYTEDSEPTAWSELCDPESLRPRGTQRKFKFFYPQGFTKKIPEPQKINLNVP